MLQLETPKYSSDGPVKLTRFFAELAHASSRALLLDYDGTLAPFCKDRDAALPYPGVTGLLDRIRYSTNTRVVIATGRRAQSAATLLGLPGVEIWGCHGQERLSSNGTREFVAVSEQILSRISEANELLRQAGLSGHLELKPVSIAVHWRGMEARANVMAHQVENVWSKLSSREGLQLMSFEGGIEIRAAMKNKADVTRTILAEMGWGTAMAYLGDDQTDEDAFAALQGFGLSVLVQAKYRPTVADLWVCAPQGMIAFLKDWLAACGGTP